MSPVSRFGPKEEIPTELRDQVVFLLLAKSGLDLKIIIAMDIDNVSHFPSSLSYL